jgi:hypothetical protein
MQSKFQNKFVLPKKTLEVHFITSLNIFSVALSLIWTGGRSQFVRISGGHTVLHFQLQTRIGNNFVVGRYVVYCWI